VGSRLSGAGFSERLREAAEPWWRGQLEHPFVRGIGDGTLAARRFCHYLGQDYALLIECGRLYGLACARAPRPEDAAAFARLAHETFVTELEAHRSLARKWRLTRADLESTAMTPTTRAYSDFLLRTAALGDFGELAGALLPCIVGYREIGERLAEGGPPRDDRYALWIEHYAGDDYGKLADWACRLVDAVAEDLGGGGKDRMLRAFVESSRHELAFWEGAWRLEEALPVPDEAPSSGRSAH